MLELPADERPRERLLSGGARSLSDAELISVLLGSGAPGVSALTLARSVLGRHGGLYGLLSQSFEGLRMRGIGEAKCCRLLAAFELASRLARAELPDRIPLVRPAAAAKYLLLRYGQRDQEVMGAIYLDSRSRVLKDLEIYRGTLQRALVEPRHILRHALVLGASRVVAFHTHPSGDPTPSDEDISFTHRLATAGKILGVSVVDHLVLGTMTSWVSLREAGILKDSPARKRSEDDRRFAGS